TCGFYVTSSGGCSTANDDADADGIMDLADSCPAQSDPAVISGGPQRDRDRDGLGDACDPAGAFDDAGDGVPDDLVTFQGTLACKRLPRVNLALVEPPTHLDIDGDHDAFPDTGERGRVSLKLKNLGDALQDAVITLTSTDPDVACIPEPQVRIPSFPAGATLTVGSLDSAQPGFTFVASDTLQTQSQPAVQAFVDLGIRATAAGHLGVNGPLSFSLLADVNMTGGPQQFIPGPDGISGTADDGQVVEKFDIDRNGDGKFTVKD